MAKVSKRVRALLRYQREKVDHYQLSQVAALRTLYHTAILEVQTKLARAIASGQGSTFTSQTYRLALIQLREGVTAAMQKWGAQLALTASELAVEAPRDLRNNIAGLERIYTGHAPDLPIEQAAVFHGLQQARAPSLLSAHQTSINRYGQRLIDAGQQQLALTLATGGSPWEAQNRIQTTMGTNWWQAERIARTEISYAYNAAFSDSLVAVKAELLPDLWGRWCELIDDTTGRPYDARVAQDSVVLHGQVAVPGGYFVMPVDNRASPKVWGLSWNGPPNRPNDRASLGAWRPHWSDIPAWRVVGGVRAEFTEDERLAMRKAARLAVRGQHVPEDAELGAF